MLNMTKNSLNLKCIVLFIASMNAGSAMKDTTEEPEYSTLYRSASHIIHPDWNEHDVDLMLNQIEICLNQGDNLEKFTDPIHWLNRPISNREQLQKAISLQNRIVHIPGIECLLGITDMRLGRIYEYGGIKHSFGTLSQEEISFLANLPHLRLFHLAGCSNTMAELRPLYECLSRYPLVSLHISSSTLHHNVLLLLKSMDTLKRISFSGCTKLTPNKLTEFLISLPEGMEELDLLYTNLTDEGLNGIASFQGLKLLGISGSSLNLENLLAHLPKCIEELYLRHINLTNEELDTITRFQELKKLDIGSCTFIGSSTVEHILSQLPKGIDFTDHNFKSRTIRKGNLTPPKKRKLNIK